MTAESPLPSKPSEQEGSRGQSSRVQRVAEEMMDRFGFVGVPRETFEVGGRAQFVRLLQHGLNPESKVLEIGCGCLRVGYWLIRFLDPGCYFGIEPAEDRVGHGKDYLLGEKLLELKKPSFDYNAVFDTSVFDAHRFGGFDFFVAGSIWTHCSKEHIRRTLDGFVADTGPRGIFLTSCLPALGDEDDYQGDTWVGTSHESDEPGVVSHSFSWIRAECELRNLGLTAIQGIDCDSQFWLRIDKDPDRFFSAIPSRS